MKLGIGVISVLALLVACGENEDAAKEVAYDRAQLFSGGFLDTKDLVPLEKMADMNASVVENFVKTSDPFYSRLIRQKLTNPPPKSDIQTCLDNIIDGNRPDRGFEHFKTMFEADFGSCMSNIEDKLAKVKMFFAVACTGGDFTQDDNVSNLEFAGVGADRCINATGDILIQENQLVNQAINSPEGIRHKKTIKYLQTEDGQPCEYKFTDGSLKLDACRYSQQVLLNLPGEAPSEMYIYVNLILKNLVRKSGDAGIYFESGSIEVQVNDWKGLIGYNGTNEAPNVFLANGTQNIVFTLAPPEPGQ